LKGYKTADTTIGQSVGHSVSIITA